MEEIQFTFNGESKRLTREQVVKAMRAQVPGTIQTYAVRVDGRLFPVKQVLASALQVPRASFISTRARELLSKLDFEVVNVEDGLGSDDSITAVPTDPDRRQIALELAVELASPGATADEVIATAERFAAWLER